MTEADVATILRSVLRFIAQCHTKGIIYRDVKPDNFLFLTSDASTVKATDFGLSIRYSSMPDAAQHHLLLTRHVTQPDAGLVFHHARQLRHFVKQQMGRQVCAVVCWFHLLRC